MKKKLLICLLFLIPIAIGIYMYVYQDHRDIMTEKVAVTVSSEDLVVEFQENDEAAMQKYGDQTIAVSGNVVEIMDSAILLDGGVLCAFAKADLTHLEVGKSISIKGRCTGYDDLLEEVRIDQSTILK